MSTERRQVARNATSAYAGRGLLILSVLLLTPYLFRSLGQGGFGTWSVMFTLATVFSVLEVSFSASISARIAELAGEGPDEALGPVVRAGAAVMAVVGVLALAVSAAVAFGASSLAAPGDEAAFRDGMLVLGAAMLLRLPCVAFGAALRGRQRYDLFQAGEATAVVVFAAGAVVALESGGGILALAVAQGVGLVLGGLLFVVLLLTTLPGGLGGAGTDHRRLASFGSWALLSESMMFVAERMDTIIIAAIRGAAAAAPYAAAQKLRSGLQSLTYPFFGLLLPMAAELLAAGRRDEVARRLVLATRVAVQVSLPVASALALFSPDVVDLWLGPTAPASTADIVLVLMIVELLAITATPSHEILIGTGGVRLMGVFGVVDGAANIALSIALISTYGAIGAALGTLITSALFGLLKVPLAMRATACPAGRLLRDGLAPALAASAAPLGIMTAAFVLLDQGPARFLLGTGLGVGVAALIGLRQAGIRRPGDLRAVAGNPPPGPAGVLE
jgi:O-antigen/teichoic acid export membrane protein